MTGMIATSSLDTQSIARGSIAVKGPYTTASQQTHLTQDIVEILSDDEEDEEEEEFDYESLEESIKVVSNI